MEDIRHRLQVATEDPTRPPAELRHDPPARAGRRIAVVAVNVVVALVLWAAGTVGIAFAVLVGFAIAGESSPDLQRGVIVTASLVSLFLACRLALRRIRNGWKRWAAD